MTGPADWDAEQYLRFEDERTRPALDLLESVPLLEPRHCIDLGCGPGNSTELIAARFPRARLEGLDSSPDMLETARKRLPEVTFTLGDVATWSARDRYDLVFANAVLQWVPDHPHLMQRLVRALTSDGVLAMQMPNNLAEPSHVAMEEVAAEGAWASRLANARRDKATIGTFADYRRWLMDAGCDVDIWETTYLHALAGPDAIIEWFKGTGLRPFLEPLTNEERARFLARYREKIASAYPPEPDGKVLLRFPRLFVVATRRP